MEYLWIFVNLILWFMTFYPLYPFCMIYRELFTKCLVMLQGILGIIIIIVLYIFIGSMESLKD